MADLGISGLSNTGINIDQQINNILSAEFGPRYENLTIEQSELESAKTAWRDVNSKLSSLEGKVTDLKLSATFNSMQTTSTDEDVATATANSDAVVTSYDLHVDQLAQNHRLASDKQSDSDTALNLGSGSFELAVDGTNIKIDGIDNTTTLNDLVNNINSDSQNDDGDGDKLIQASVVDDRLILESTKTGTINTINQVDDSSGILSSLGLDDFSQGSSDTIQQAQDAQFDVNGIQDITRSSNEAINDVVDNVTFNLKDTGDTTIKVSPDLDKASSAVQKFVDQYNSSMSFISDKLDYNSSTDDAGALQGDGTLMRLSSNVRQEVMDRVNSGDNYDHLSMVGIEIDETGTMSFDETKFKEALEEDPTQVRKLFNADSDSGDSFDGIATRLDSYLDTLTSTTGTIPDTVDYYEDQISNIDDEIDNLRDDMQNKKDRLEAKFTNMETSLSSMQNQMSWMQSQLSNMGGGSISTLLGSL